MRAKAFPTAYRRTAVLALRWAVPIAVIVAFILTGHLGEAITALSGVSLVWALPLVLVGVSLPLSHSWRWRFLLKRTSVDIPLSGATRITALASLINYAAPGFLGAPAKAVLARDAHQVPVSRSLPTLAVEQLLDALLLAIGGAVAVILVGPAVFSGITSTELVDGAIAVVVTGALVFVALGLTWFLLGRLLPAFVKALSEATTVLVRSRKYRAPIISLTCARWLLDMTAITIASLAVGLRLGLLDVLLLANLALLAGLIAPIPGGLGVREAVLASLAGVLGISIPAVIALSVVHRAGLALGLPLVLVGARASEWRTR